MFDFWQEIYGTIKRNKMRTLLTGFSVAWGIFILIILLGAGNGLINAFDANSSGTSLNSMRIYPGVMSMPYHGLSTGKPIIFSNRDVQILKDNFKDNVVVAGSTISHTDSVSYGTEGLSMTLTGVDMNYGKIESCKIIKGRFINQVDLDKMRKVIVISDQSRKVLFRNQINPIGFKVDVNGLVYTVAGVYDSGNDRQSNEAFIPFTTGQRVYCRADTIDDIIFSTRKLNTIEEGDAFEGDYRKVMSGVHNFDPLDKSTLWIWNRMEQYLSQQKGHNILKLMIWIIGILTLLSGIVGVSNIMLITVRERTREFGIRKALGAKPWSILRLIIAESITITAVSGYVGMFLGIMATEYMNVLFGNQKMDAGVFSTTVFTNPTVDINVAIQATVALIIAGTLAGFFPARKATRIRPIEALRAE